MTHFVYAIGARGGRFVKIGWTAASPESRRATFQTGHHDELVVLAQTEVDSGPRIERLLHKRFAPRRTRGEWFEVGGDLKEMITKERLAELVAFEIFSEGHPPKKVKRVLDGLSAEYAMHGKARVEAILGGMRLVCPCFYLVMMGVVSGLLNAGDADKALVFILGAT